MIIGIGIDMIETSRIEKSSNSFIAKVFTERELEIYYKRGKNSEFLAGNFAAKEAVSKAFGTGFRNFTPIDIEILRESSGKPYVILHGGASQAADTLGISRIHISITNTKEYAAAYVIAE